MHELQTLLDLARTAYKEEGVPDKKSVSRFIEDFVNEQRYIDCDKAYCRNFHRRNIHIVGGILSCEELRKRLMEMKDFTMKDCEKLLHEYNTSEAPPSPRPTNTTGTADALTPPHPTGIPDTNPPLSFRCTLTEEQMLHLSQLESMEHLFCFNKDKGETVDLKPLFECKKGYTLKVKNPRLVAFFFNTLFKEGYIRWDWKIVMGRGGFLLSKNGKPISANALAVDLNRAITRVDPDADEAKSEWLYCLRTSTFTTK